MKIHKITFTGADNSVDPEKMVKLSLQYPIIEWGILVSKAKEGSPRYPSVEWMKELRRVGKNKISVACHLCGKWAKDLIVCDDQIFIDRSEIFDISQRIQLNIKISRHDQKAIEILPFTLASLNKEYIIPITDDDSVDIFKTMIFDNVKHSILFDRSGGRGKTPSEWPLPLEGISCGYAGGFGPDNITEELSKLSAILGDYTTWIDMETNVRSRNDKLFDLDKVKEVLNQSKDYH